jgi:hypothetical protein
MAGLKRGWVPGKEQSKGAMWVLGSATVEVFAAEKSLRVVLSCECTSNPQNTSHSSLDDSMKLAFERLDLLRSFRERFWDFWKEAVMGVPSSGVVLGSGVVEVGVERSRRV